MKKVVVSGKRKSAVARAVVSEGNFKVFVNGTPLESLNRLHQLIIDEPIKLYEQVIGNLKASIFVNTRGGGKEGQIQAARLAIGKALMKWSDSQELRKAFLAYDRQLLVADTRRKEAYKPGDSKARKKRQKSYR